MPIRKRKRNSYDINQSPLFRLKSKRKLAGIFDLPTQEIESLANRDDNYREFVIGKASEKTRRIEEPKPHLERVHRRLFTLLSRIEAPAYLHSGVNGKSYISNAKAHLESSTAITLDIERFFPSTLGWHVFEFFKSTMECSDDVAALLTKLSTVRGHVPTGSCLSQVIAFYAHKTMFDEINALAEENGFKMTCYVDDITISGPDVGHSLLYKVRGILQRRGLKSKTKKEAVYRNGAAFQITGTIIKGGGIFLPNRKHKVIHDEVLKILQILPLEERPKQIEKTIGRIIAATLLDDGMNKWLPLLRQHNINVIRRLRKQ
jgi:hypothetical protein